MSTSPVSGRAPVSVIVPFRGTAAEARATLARLEYLELGPDDELIVSDNTQHGLVRAERGDSDVRIVRAHAERSSYYARNVGGEAARNDWLLFIDSDCRPARTLLDDYFAQPVEERCGVIAGAVVAAPEQRALIARYARSRRHISEAFHITTGPRPAGISANLLVRRVAWESIGGFQEGIRSGGDIEFCWRAQELGWALVHRPAARVEHLHAVRLRAMVAKAARHAAGRLWVNRRYPGTFPRPRLVRPLGRCAVGALVWMATGKPQRALFKLIDATWFGADEYGYLLGDNRAERVAGLGREGEGPAAPGERGMVFVTDAFPASSETFIVNEVRALREAGWRVRCEVAARPARPDRSAVRDLPISYMEDDPPKEKLSDLAWLVSRHPIQCLRDLLERRRWAREEPVWPLAALAPAARRLERGRESHLHVHFAAGSALHALRLSSLLGVPYSLVAHAFDVFQQPRNLREKLERAAFVVGPCEYTSSYLRELVSEQRSTVHTIVMGVDGKHFTRRRPHPGGRSVVAIGRLVEKKGFVHLIEAAYRLKDVAPLDSVTIAGDGPLRPGLAERIERLGLSDTVELRSDTWGFEAVRDLLEGADLVVMPSVVAADGDRDAMPVVVKEALAMEVPVVASDEVGLPEVIRPEWGLLVPPGDPIALAQGIFELLALPSAERAAMGAAGREFVLRHCEVRRETAKLAHLITGDATGPDRDVHSKTGIAEADLEHGRPVAEGRAQHGV